MAGAVVPLAGDFPAPDIEAWRALVAKTLGGAGVETIVSHTDEGLPIEPLYAAATAAPALSLGERDADRPWDVRCATSHPDPARANADMLADLEGGAASVLVRIDPTGAAGVAVGSAEGMARLTDGVILELAKLALDAGFLGPKAADWLGAAAKSAPNAILAFHMDPLSALARAGTSPGPIESHLISAATVGARLAETYPKASLFLASGQVVHEAGGGEAQELGFMAASAAAYARALMRAGLTADAAFARITLGLAIDSDYFVSIAKLRAARLIWARLTSASGAPMPATIEARSSRRMLTVLDPWTNMLRLTAAGFAGAVGGADAVVLGAFTDALGLPAAMARRQSRNAQLVLLEEAALGRVADPSHGSGYIEAMTDQLARAGWAAFRSIEAQGGIVAHLASGAAAAEATETLTRRRAAIASGDAKIIGVTVFRNASDAVVPVEAVNGAAFAVDAPSARLPGPDTVVATLAPVRLAEPFEGEG
jgi:methylmalonyl-CoA mutase